MNSRDKYILQNIKTAGLFADNTPKSTSASFAVAPTEDKTFDNPIATNNGENHSIDFADIPTISAAADFSVGAAIFSPLPVNSLDELSDEILNDARRYPQNLEAEMY